MSLLPLTPLAFAALRTRSYCTTHTPLLRRALSRPVDVARHKPEPLRVVPVRTRSILFSIAIGCGTPSDRVACAFTGVFSRRQLHIHTMSSNKATQPPDTTTKKPVPPRDKDCPVCYMGLSDAESVNCSRCNYTFCRTCVVEMRRASQRKCPMCRHPFQTNTRAVAKRLIHAFHCSAGRNCLHAHCADTKELLQKMEKHVSMRTERQQRNCKVSKLWNGLKLTTPESGQLDE